MCGPLWLHATSEMISSWNVTACSPRRGRRAASYWSAVRRLLWWKPGFEGRVRRGAADLVNSLLDYGYGILYSRLMNVLVRAGLNVHIGFLHKPQKGKAGLLYDFIEEFRAPAVDRTVFSWLNLGVDAKATEEGLTSRNSAGISAEDCGTALGRNEISWRAIGARASDGTASPTPGAASGRQRDLQKLRPTLVTVCEKPVQDSF